MNTRRILPALLVSTIASAGLVNNPAPASSWWPWGGSAVRLPVADGAVEVTLRPDRGGAMRLQQDGPNRWVFTGDTARLVGEPYSIVLDNRTGERLKVVVGVDGLNVYGRDELGGRADRDVGSILQPWSSRTLSGWQVDDRRAQRFVFSPPEWSEGEGRTDPEIGLVTVEVYREWRPRYWEDDYETRRRSDSGSAAEAAPPGGLQAPSSKPAGPQDSRAEGPRTQAQPPIGTTAGEDVHSDVRTVRFVPATSYPEASATIDYGRTRQAYQPDYPDYGYGEGVLGLELTEVRGGSRIVDVARGSRGERAGLRRGDVIVRIDSIYEPAPETLRRVVERKDRGDYTFLRVRRGGDEIAVKLQI